MEPAYRSKEPTARSDHPCVTGWKVDYSFYLASARDYIHRAKTTTDKYSKNIWLDYASSAIIGCEDCIRRMEEINGSAKSPRESIRDFGRCI